MRTENIPAPPSPEQPPLAPYDPPAPAPQAAAWRRAIKVVMRQEARLSAALAAPRSGSSRHIDRSGRNLSRHHAHAT
jgi:hypothetical protein